MECCCSELEVEISDNLHLILTTIWNLVDLSTELPRVLYCTDIYEMETCDCLDSLMLQQT